MAASASSQLPRSLRNAGDVLVIEWTDGVTHRLPWSELRKRCPCASCRTEREQPSPPPALLPVIRPEEAAPIRPTAMQPMGHYAYHIAFSDGHTSGIYTLDFLRQLGTDLASTDSGTA
ncbi:MAG TPA: DUF971 domain-containing protein [Planctomycetaceae bacterium]|nr:DUF971 domain-containing protein [Planctomycetaceae bacterium]